MQDADGESFVMQQGAPTEGRVTPLVGVIQTTGTVINETGDVVLVNKAKARVNA